MPDYYIFYQTTGLVAGEPMLSSPQVNEEHIFKGAIGITPSSKSSEFGVFHQGYMQDL